MMNNILIIGAGAMGSAIARGLARAGKKVTIWNRSEERLASLMNIDGLTCSWDLNSVLADDSYDLIILALPRGAVQEMCGAVAGLAPVASLSPMTTLESLRTMCKEKNAVLRIMPNIGITHGQSMTFICGSDNSVTGDAVELFTTLGDAALIPESQFPAVTALASCGTAYALRYIRACMQAGVQMGLEADEACRYTLQTLRGACAMLEDGRVHPEAALDRVCTPGGLTIRGVNTLDEKGFSTAVISAILASEKK